MGLMDLFKKTFPLLHYHPKLEYDMDSLEGINSIPVPAQNYSSGRDINDCIYYLLQRKATEHKKNGNIELAIACLRKSNALSDYESRPLLTQKEYLRLVKYIEYSGNKELAKQELNEIYRIHPEFLDRRISNLKIINETLAICQTRNNDLVCVSTSNSCPVCSKYNLKVFSISGQTKNYPKLPKEILIDGGFCSKCYLGLTIFYEGISRLKQGK